MRASVWGALLFSVVAGSDDGDTVLLSGRSVQLDTVPTSQLANRPAVHEVGGAEIRISGRAFAVERARGSLRVATRPGEPARRTVGSEKTVTLCWEDDGADREMTLRLFGQPGADGENETWSYHAVGAVAYEIDGERIRLVDVNADGAFDPDADGWIPDGSEVLCPLVRRLVIGGSRVEIVSLSRDGHTLEARVERIAGTEIQKKALREINLRRVRHGLLPVDLSEELSASCTDHAEYLARHGWDGRADPHSQSLGPDGASAEGLRAAQSSVISKGSAADSIDVLWRTYYHRVPMMSPRLEVIGINAAPAGIAVIDVLRGVGRSGSGDFAEPIVVPADGSSEVPTQAAAELPQEPVPDLASRGMPLMLWFEGNSPKVERFSATLVSRRGRAEREVDVLIADQWRMKHVFGAVPERPLKRDTQYRATFRFRLDGVDVTKVVDFRTE